MRIYVDADRCSGHGRCYALAPRVYSADEEGYCLGRGGYMDVAPEDEQAAEIGAAGCPERAITIKR